VAVLIDHLPAESAIKTVLRDQLGPRQQAELAKRVGAGHGSWSHVEMLLAAVYDQLSWVLYVTAAAAGAKPAKPVPYPRPGVDAATKGPLSDEQIQMLEQSRARNREAAGGD